MKNSSLSMFKIFFLFFTIIIYFSPAFGLDNFFDLVGICNGICLDGTISIEPLDASLWGYEGRCGETAALNTIGMYCNRAISSEEYLENTQPDLTPGSRPSTIRAGLNYYFSRKNECTGEGAWAIYHSDSSNYITDLTIALSEQNIISREIEIDGGNLVVESAPIVLLVDTGTPHWIVLIDIRNNDDSCVATFNDMGAQWTISCNDLTKWGNLGEKSLCTGDITEAICGNFTYLKLNRSGRDPQHLPSLDEITLQHVTGYFTEDLSEYYDPKGVSGATVYYAYEQEGYFSETIPQYYSDRAKDIADFTSSTLSSFWHTVWN